MRTHKKLIGWREWVSLPRLGVPPVKAKVDTGARSSALHAFDLDVIERGGRSWVRFAVHPLQRSAVGERIVEHELHEWRWIRSSTGQRTLRPPGLSGRSSPASAGGNHRARPQGLRPVAVGHGMGGVRARADRDGRGLRFFLPGGGDVRNAASPHEIWGIDP